MVNIDRVVLVTGATSGIGRETAETLAAEGWKVVVSGRRQDVGEKVVAGIKAKGDEATFVRADMSSEEDVETLVDKTVELYGRIDGAVNNAGIATEAAPLADLSTEQFQKMLQVNVLGVFWCMKYQLKHMLPAKSGRIVNLASIAGIGGVPNSATYSATKHAVVGLTKSASIECARDGITINAVAPGPVKTEIIQHFVEDGSYTEESIASILPMKRMGVPSDIARAVSFLLNSPFATGTILSVDGGFAV